MSNLLAFLDSHTVFRLSFSIFPFHFTRMLFCLLHSTFLHPCIHHHSFPSRFFCSFVCLFCLFLVLGDFFVLFLFFIFSFAKRRPNEGYILLHYIYLFMGIIVLVFYVVLSLKLVSKSTVLISCCLHVSNFSLFSKCLNMWSESCGLPPTLFGETKLKQPKAFFFRAWVQ